MGQVIQLSSRASGQSLSDVQAQLAHCFARARRAEDDVFWLKENAEFLNIHETAGAQFDARAIEPYERFYSEAWERLRSFPQYYGFFLSMVLDLEDLGMEGRQGEQMCAWALSQDLMKAELSDLQRARAQRLFLRRGIGEEDKALRMRLIRFINRYETFALSNQKAAYELTHIVFYLSEYGRRSPKLSTKALRSLKFAGTLALIDENVDLLAEICIAFRYAGKPPPASWEAWVRERLAGFKVDASVGIHTDAYHEFLVCNWLEMIAKRRGFRTSVPQGCNAFSRRRGSFGLLRRFSEALFHVPARKRGSWAQQKANLIKGLDAGARAHLSMAERALGEFEAFLRYSHVAGTALLFGTRARRTRRSRKSLRHWDCRSQSGPR